MSGVFELVRMLVADVVFVGLCLAGLLALSSFKQTHAAYAVMRRNFVGYFSNPTGYVFLCLFVMLTSVAAFWPHDFFAANLANLDQLNKYFPYIMLMFIPAITMSIWAEERRQGTDELLLTLPATDFDIVMGKFLAAAAIFTCSLLFSQISNYVVLIALSLGDLDSGLLLSTYFGYWLVGLAMISLGMVASFLTSNLTVGFVLGALVNAPLAFASNVDTLVTSNGLSRAIAKWGLLDRMESFGRGVMSLSSLSYFLVIVAVGLYLSMVLIGRRHWSGGRDGTSMLGHYMLRAFSIVLFGVGIVLCFTWKDVRLDVTEGQVSSLSKDTQKLLRDLDTDGKTIYIVAYLSETVPDDYVKTRLQLLTMLKEFASRASTKISLTIHDGLQEFHEKTKEAESQGVLPQQIRTMERGKIRDHEVVMGAVFRCGLDKVTVPFFDYGVPIEYELIRSISTVSQEKRKRVGFVKTTANMFGGVSFAGGRPQMLPTREIITELQKQYDVREVDPTKVIPTEEYDALVVVQPSSLSPPGMDNLLAAIRAGVPTAVFEDPQPTFIGSNVPAPNDPNPSMGGGNPMMMGMGGQQQPKADLRRLWNMLGITSPHAPGGPSGVKPNVIWHAYNPYRKLAEAANVNEAWVFVSTDADDAKNSLNQGDAVTEGLTQLFLPYPGAVEKQSTSQLTFTPLVTTHGATGQIDFDKLRLVMNTGGGREEFRRNMGGENKKKQVLAARIRGLIEDDDALMQGPADEKEAASDGGAADGADEPAKEMNVIYVADIDLMSDMFLRIRARPGDVGANLNLRFENITFMLNVIDDLTGDTRYVDIRKRKPYLTTLKLVEAKIADSQQRADSEEKKYREIYKKAIAEQEAAQEKEIAELRKQEEDLRARERRGEQIDIQKLQAAQVRAAMRVSSSRKKLEATRETLESELNTNLKSLRDETEQFVSRTQGNYKMWALFVPMLPPILVGVIVFIQRRLRERDTVMRDPERRV